MLGSAWSASAAAPVPRPPQPTNPILIWSEPWAYAKLPEARSAAPELAAAAVFKNVRRLGRSPPGFTSFDMPSPRHLCSGRSRHVDRPHSAPLDRFVLQFEDEESVSCRSGRCASGDIGCIQNGKRRAGTEKSTYHHSARQRRKVGNESPTRRSASGPRGERSPDGH